MSITPATKLEFDLGTGITLRIGKSSVTARFQFAKGEFTDYLAANNKKISALDYYIYDSSVSSKVYLDLTDGTVSGTKHNIAMPNGLLPLLITHLEQAAAGTTPKDDAPTPK
jgi:hypothetical protein